MPAFIKVDLLLAPFLSRTERLFDWPGPALIESDLLSESSMIKSRSSLWLSYFTPANRFGFLGGRELLPCPDGAFVNLILVSTAFFALFFFVSSCLNLAFSIFASMASSFAYSAAYLSKRFFSAIDLASVSFFS